MPPGGFKPPPAAPVKPYKPIAITPPAPYDDQSFVAFRKQLTAIAQHKDRAALAKVVVPQGFFWMQDKDLADKRKPSIANLAAAINLDAKDDSGWAAIAGYANDPTASALPDRQGVICAPADPTIDPKAFEALTQSTKTEPPDWGYPTKEGIEVHSGPKPNTHGHRKARPVSGPRATRQHTGRRPRPAAIPSHRAAVGKDRLRSRGHDLRAWRRRDVLQQGTKRLDDRRLFRRRAQSVRLKLVIAVFPGYE